MGATDWRIVVAVLVAGILLTVARRWHNEEPNAGAGAAGATLFILGLYVMSHR